MINFFVKIFAMIGVSSSLLFIITFLIISSLARDVGTKKSLIAPDLEDSIVEYEIDGTIQSRNPDPKDQFFAGLFGGEREVSLSDLRQSLRRAAEDIRVRGVYMNLRHMTAGFTTIQEFRRALVEFRASGKPLYVNMYSGDTLSYFLASAADQINLSPLGGLMIPGPAFQLTYFGPALAKLGLEMEVFRAGKYKSAMEPFVRSEPSTESLEMYRSMEATLRQLLVDDISKSRGKPVAEVASWFKISSFTSSQAQRMGAVDLVTYEDHLRSKLQEETKTEKYVKWQSYLNHSDDIDEARMAKGDEAIGYLEATGEIRMNAEGNDERVITPKQMVEQLKWLGNEADIKAVVMRVDSPGGSALASDIIWDEVRKLAAIKPVVVTMSGVAASGGYYIAAPATKILAEPQTITGSIGVIGASLVGHEIDEKYGVSFHVVTQSDRVAYMNFGEYASSEDQRIVNQSIDEVYQTFLEKVAAGRSMTKDRVHELAQGRVYTGKEALDLGLVDYLGGRFAAFRVAKELAKLNPEKLYPLRQYQPKAKSVFDCFGHKERFMECLQELDTSLSLLPSHPLQQQALEPLQRMYQLMRDDRTLMFWPGRVAWSVDEGQL